MTTSKAMETANRRDRAWTSARRAPSPADATVRARWRLAGLLAATVVLGALVVISLAVGSKAIPPSVVWDAIFNPSNEVDQFSVRDYRVPRTAVGLAVGIALGVAGALIQALTRNPLAEPGILGVNAGAAFAVALAVGILGISDIKFYMWFALVGALVVTVTVMLLGGMRQARGTSGMMVLAGVAVGAVLNGATSGLTLLDSAAFDQMRYWHAGSIVGRPLELLLPVSPFLVAGLVIALVASRSLNAMAMGDEVATAQGARVVRTRVLSVAAIALLAGGATALAGPIGFIGLMVPHVARWIVGPDQRWIVAYCVVLAPCVLLTSDIVGRVIMIPSEIPVGIVTAFVGAPVLIVLVRRAKVSGL